MPSSGARTASSSQSREGRHRRSRSSGRSRSRHREQRNHSRSHFRFRFKHKERNFPAAVCSMISIVLLCVAMAEPKWISLKGGSCCVHNAPKGSLHHLGVYQFFYIGNMIPDPQTPKSHMYQYGADEYEVLVDCVSYEAVVFFKTVICFCFFTVLFSLCAFLLDLTGPSGKMLQRLHRNAIFSIITVAMCVVINIFCYLISSFVEAVQTETRLHPGSKVDVTFDISFYLISAAGSLSVFAVACNCFRRYPLHEEAPYHRLDECDDLESLAANLGPDMSPLASMPPPPAYTPTATPSNPGSNTSLDPLPSTASLALSVNA